ncbi:MAG: hypothetical protein ACK5B9_09555 [Flavobacteriia bacterium]|jgi:hypothetical protein
MDREKLIKQLFIGKVADIIGNQKTTELLKESTFVIDEMIKSRKADVIKSVCDNEWHEMDLAVHGKCGVCKERVK